MPEDAYSITPAPDPDDEHSHDDPSEYDTTSAAPDALTAFMVIVRPDGTAVATHEIVDITIDHPATLEEMHRAVREVEGDITAARTAREVVIAMQQQAQAMMQAQQEAALRAKLAQGGLKVPGR